FCGLCPLHDEKTPSFTVNPEKNVWYCHGCHEGGDTISFVMKLHGVDFKDALKLLKIDGDLRPEPEAIRRREQAKQISRWAKGLSTRTRDRLLEIDQSRHVLGELRKLKGADSAFVVQESGILERQWKILCDLDDDLNTAATAVQMFEDR